MNTVPDSAEWRERFFSSTRGRIILLLRREQGTVNELAEHLNLTDNAVRSHLASLERDGLVERTGERRGAGKPSVTYGVTSDAEQLFPKAYDLVLSSLLATLEDRLDATTHMELLREAGRRLSPQIDPDQDDGIERRIELAAELLTDLGGLAEVDTRDGRPIIQGRSCPLLSTAAQRPEICQLAASLLETLIQAPVTACCRHGDRPRCCFEIAV